MVVHSFGFYKSQMNIGLRLSQIVTKVLQSNVYAKVDISCEKMVKILMKDQELDSSLDVDEGKVKKMVQHSF